MNFIQGEGRSRGGGALFPAVLDDLIPADHVCRVLDAFVAGLAMAAFLPFVRHCNTTILPPPGRKSRLHKAWCEITDCDEANIWHHLSC